MRKFLPHITILAAVICLLYVFCLIRPYKNLVRSINRRTGALITDTYNFGIHITHEQRDPKHWYEVPEKFGPLIAPDIRLAYNELQVRYPWSNGPTNDVTHSKNMDIQEYFYQAFVALNAINWDHRIPDQQFDVLMKERVAIWNSTLTDVDLKSLIERIMDENNIFIKSKNPQ
jgi:hypothetical protein